MNRIYSYRLTSFSNAAPCTDDDFLTLAICKRDMRRIIGRQLAAGTDDAVWILGIVGKSLSAYDEFSGRAGDFLYLAKLTGVRTFESYFGSGGNRKDMIYFPCSDGRYGKGKQKFNPKPDNGIHDSEELWDRDWDTAHPSAENYVLCSDSFCVLTRGQSDGIRERSPENAVYPDRQGHRCFSAEDASELITYFNALIGDFSQSKLSDFCSTKPCGRVKAV